MQARAMPQIAESLKKEVAEVFNKAVRDFKHVMEQFMKTHQIHDKQFTSETTIDFTKKWYEGLWDFVSTVLFPILALRALVAANSWSYDGAMDSLAETWASKFDESVRYKIQFDIGKLYQEMVVDCEKQNSFCT